MENWKPVPVVGYEAAYSISDLGNVRSEERIVLIQDKPTRLKSKILKPSFDTKGYSFVILCVKRKTKVCRIHTMLLTAFGPPRPANACLVRHLDDNRQNNILSNLVWGTKADNSLDLVKNSHGVHPRAKLTIEQVLEIRRRYSKGESGRKLSKEFQLSVSSTYQIINRVSWTHIKDRARL